MSVVDLITTAASVAGGGLFGAIGSIGTAYFKNKVKKQEQTHELAVMTQESDTQLKEREHDLRAAEAGHLQTLAEARQSASSAGLIASISADGLQNLPTWAAGLKAAYRPLLTTFLVINCMYIFTLLLDAMAGDGALAKVFPKDDLIEMIRYTVYSSVFTASTAVVWWYGERGLTPPSLK